MSLSYIYIYDTPPSVVVVVVVDDNDDSIKKQRENELDSYLIFFTILQFFSFYRIMNNNEQHQQQSSKKDDSEQGWCKVTFKLDTSECPQIIRYPRSGPPTLLSLEQRKESAMNNEKKLNEECEREHIKRMKNLRLANRHRLFDIKPVPINETNIYF